MRTLLLMRHAKSSWDDDNLPDEDRPLNSRGKRDAPRMAQLLVEEGLQPQLILSSPARRARKTAERVASVCEFSGLIECRDVLYHGTIDQLLDVLRGLPDDAECVLVIGHNPGFEGLLEQLLGGFHRLPTAAIACLTYDAEHWHDLEPGSPALQLKAVWRPKEIGPN